MTTDEIERSTALAKLARVLEVAPTELALVADLPVAELRALRDQVSDHLAEAHRARLATVVAASKLVPTALAATIGERWFGPVLCAHLVGLVEPVRGGQFAKHLSVGFMADITARTDPRVVGELVDHLSLATMQGIALELLARGDHLTLSHFVGHLPAPVVGSILEAIDDDAAVVRIARFVDDLDHLDPVVALLPDDRILRLVAAVADEDLWPEALHLFGALGDEQILRVATTIVRQDATAVAAALEGIDRHDLWDRGLALIEHLHPVDLVTVADVLLVLDDAVVDRTVAAIEALDAWPLLVRVGLVADDLTPAVRTRLRELVDRLPTQQVGRFEAAAAAAGHPDLLARVLAGGAAA